MAPLSTLPLLLLFMAYRVLSPSSTPRNGTFASCLVPMAAMMTFVAGPQRHSPLLHFDLEIELRPPCFTLEL